MRKHRKTHSRRPSQETVYLAFDHEAWDFSHGIPEPLAGFLTEEFPEIPLNLEVEVVWPIVVHEGDEKDAELLKQRVFLLAVAEDRLNELVDGLSALSLSPEQDATCCFAVRTVPLPGHPNAEQREVVLF